MVLGFDKDKIQADQYSFPYHYLLEIQNDSLSFKKFFYGFEYFTYLSIIKNIIDGLSHVSESYLPGLPSKHLDKICFSLPNSWQLIPRPTPPTPAST